MNKNLKILLAIFVVILGTTITVYYYEKKTIEISQSIQPEIIAHHVKKDVGIQNPSLPPPNKYPQTGPLH